MKLALAMVVLMGCVDEGSDEPPVSNVGKTVTAMCGPAPELPKIQVVADGDKLVISQESYDSISYYVFTNAFWRECVLDL